MATTEQKNGRTRWEILQESTFALASKCEYFDHDGITVYVFSNTFQRYDHVTSAKVKQVFAEHQPGGTTNLAGVLQNTINNYFQRKVEGKTKKNGEIILVVTDGEPCDLNRRYEPEDFCSRGRCSERPALPALVAEACPSFSP